MSNENTFYCDVCTKPLMGIRIATVETTASGDDVTSFEAVRMYGWCVAHKTRVIDGVQLGCSDEYPYYVTNAKEDSK